MSAPTAVPPASAAAAQWVSSVSSAGRSLLLDVGSPGAGRHGASAVTGRTPYGWSPMRTGGTGPSGTRLSSAHSPTS